MILHVNCCVKCMAAGGRCSSTTVIWKFNLYLCAPVYVVQLCLVKSKWEIGQNSNHIKGLFICKITTQLISSETTAVFALEDHFYEPKVGWVLTNYNPFYIFSTFFQSCQKPNQPQSPHGFIPEFHEIQSQSFYSFLFLVFSCATSATYIVKLKV